MHSSIETRYPFLDEQVFDFLARNRSAHEDEGFGDKHSSACWASVICPSRSPGRKAMFRAPFDSFTRASASVCRATVQPESLRKTGYFDVEAVQHWRKAFTQMASVGRSASRRDGARRRPVHAALASQFIDASLADVSFEPAMDRADAMRSLSRYLVADKIRGKAKNSFSRGACSRGLTGRALARSKLRAKH